MARFQMTLPTEIIKDFEKIHGDMDKIFGGMTQAGAKLVYEKVKAKAPAAIKNSEMMKCLTISEIYKTPSDGAINSKVAFYGYFKNDRGQVVPAPLVANVFEYGRSNPKFKTHPWFRAQWKKSEIEKVMLKAQKELSGGLLE